MGDFNDLDDLEVEVLDDELFPTPGKGDGETSDGDHAVVVKANPLSSTLPPLKKPQHAPLPPIAGQRAPLGAPLRRVSEPAGWAGLVPTRVLGAVRTSWTHLGVDRSFGRARAV